MPAAHAKINLHLEVLARETTGYHQIETLFCMLELADDVQVTLDGEDDGGSVHVDVEGADVGPPETNLAHRAATAFFATARLPASARIRLVKRIPAGAGLGGGSSDAATTLLELNALHDRPLDAATLYDVGRALGSDVPFFLSGQPYALAWGRGARLLALPPPPATPVLIVVPRTRVSTGDAYESLAAERRTHHVAAPRRLALDELRTFGDVAAFARNDFESVVFAEHPELHVIKRALARTGAIHAMLTGTGSALFGVFQEEIAARRAAADIRASHPDVETIVTATRNHITASALAETSHHAE